jgi:hypothetical protein
MCLNACLEAEPPGEADDDMTGVAALGLRADDRPAVVLARTMEDALRRGDRAEKKGRRKVFVLIGGAGAIGLAVAAKKAMDRA